MSSTRHALLLCAALAASALAAGQSASPDSRPKVERPREAAVLAILDRELDGRRATWFWRSRLVRERVGEGERIVPNIPITCGNSQGGLLPAPRASALAEKLGAAFDPKGRSAIEFDGKRLPIMDGDTFTPLAAVAADAIGRFNARHDGEDVDLALLLSGSIDVWPLPPARDAARGREASVASGGVSRFTKTTKLSFECRADANGAGAAARGEPVVVDGPVRSTAGHVALLFLPAYPTTDLEGQGTPALALRVLQHDQLMTATPATSAMVWLPSAFDAKQPFLIEAEFGPGVWTWGARVVATAPDAASR